MHENYCSILYTSVETHKFVSLYLYQKSDKLDDEHLCIFLYEIIKGEVRVLKAYQERYIDSLNP